MCYTLKNIKSIMIPKGKSNYLNVILSIPMKKY